jgi:hypothetical protein
MASDADFQRLGQRVIIYPTSITKFTACLQQGNYRSDIEGGHQIAYEQIAAQCGTFASCPIFSPEDSPNIRNWPVLEDKGSIWVEEGKQVAVSGYKQVLEDGPDVCNSESDSENSDHGEEFPDSNMFTPEMLGQDGKRIMDPQKLTPEQAERQRTAARATQKSSAEPSASVAPGTEETSGTEGEDSVDEFYGNHPEIPKCGQSVSLRAATPQEQTLVQEMLSMFPPPVPRP